MYLILQRRRQKCLEELLQAPFIKNDALSYPPAEDVPAGMTLLASYEVPCILPKTIEELLKPEQYDEIQQKYLREIFIGKFPNVVAVL